MPGVSSGKARKTLNYLGGTLDALGLRTYDALPVSRLLIAPILLFLVACGPMYRVALVGTPEADAVIGKLELEKAEGETALMTIWVRELPAADTIVEEGSHYLVWKILPDKAPLRMGELQRDRKTREGRFSAPIYEKDLVIEITAETEAEPEAPSRHIIISRRINY